MLIDIFPLFNEIEILQIRLAELYPHVDKFVIVENEYSFRGLKKPYFFEMNKSLFDLYLDKIEYIKTSIQGHEDNHKNAAMQANSLKDLTDDDVIMFGDLDEFPEGKHIEFAKLYVQSRNDYETVSFDQDLFIYRLNGRVFSNNTKEVWCGNVVFKPSLLKKHSLTYIRDNIRGKQDERHMHIKSGWHFTSIGTNEQIYEKFKNWGHWSEIPILSIEFIDDCINQGKHFHSNSNLSVKYDNNLDFLPDSVVYSGMINEKYKHLIR
jgi:beta-1,4-mannosyl-glycoprotein beta-1,4-N-acetylglucosaminyltransferase